MPALKLTCSQCHAVDDAHLGSRASWIYLSKGWTIIPIDSPIGPHHTVFCPSCYVRLTVTVPRPDL